LTTAIYSGTFDPITNGHIDIAIRAARLFSELIVAVYEAPNKHPLFTIHERVEMAKKAVVNIPNVNVQPFAELTVDFARKLNAQVMVRGLRMSADFEMEFDMAMMNNKLNPKLELICLMANAEYQFLSSTLLKEAASLGGAINGFVPAHVADALRRKVNNEM